MGQSNFNVTALATSNGGMGRLDDKFKSITKKLLQAQKALREYTLLLENEIATRKQAEEKLQALVCAQDAARPADVALPEMLDRLGTSPSLWRQLRDTYHSIRFMPIMIWSHAKKRREEAGIPTLRQCTIAFGTLLQHPWYSFKAIEALVVDECQPFWQKLPTRFLKFSRQNYSKDFSTADRAAILLNHYAYLPRHLSQAFLSKIVTGQAVVWEMDAETSSLEICLTTSSPTDREGELTLYFKMNAVGIYAMSFVIVPAGLVGVNNSGSAILVTRLQGFKGQDNLVKFATKSMVDISIPRVLMSALCGIALALEIKHILGISADKQVSTGSVSHPQDFASAYDEFWTLLGGNRLASGYFHFPAPLPEKSYALIKRHRWSRVKNRRAFRRKVTEHVRQKLGDARIDTCWQ